MAARLGQDDFVDLVKQPTIDIFMMPVERPINLERTWADQLSGANTLLGLMLFNHGIGNALFCKGYKAL
jgi:hypothetical protein